MQSIQGLDQLIDPSRLPELVQDFLGCIGLSETLALLEEFGGTSLYFAKDSESASKLKGILSADSVERLCYRFGGEEVKHMPQPDSIKKQMRDYEIIKAREHTTIAALARKHKLSKRRIEQILERERLAQSDQQESHGQT